MPHKTMFNAETGIIETALEGRVTLEEIKMIMAEATQLAVTHECYCWLNDFSRATGELTPIDIYDLPSALQEISRPLGSNAAKIKRAVVTQENRSRFEFAETVASNRGQQVKIFDTVEAARTWLLKKR